MPLIFNIFNSVIISFTGKIGNMGFWRHCHARLLHFSVALDTNPLQQASISGQLTALVASTGSFSFS
jgi:hypothetical protein